MNQEFPVLYVVINNDLNMGKGKIAAQVAHVVEDIIEELVRAEIFGAKKKKFLDDYKSWKVNGRTKIILKGSQQDLQELCKLDEARYIRDAGKTQINEGSLTAVGFFPSKTKKELLKNFKLL
jgi:PTH2 family peptidyl-tRNA hydrolase